MTKKFYLASSLFLLITCSSSAQTTNVLRQKITEVLYAKKATVGVSVSGIENRDTLTINGNQHFPMQSVFKFHIALTVLNQVDKRKFALTQKIHVSKADLLPDMWSPLRDKYPDGNVDLPLSEILSYTVSQSDNSGCDLLLRLLGGPKKANDYIHQIGIRDLAIAATEEEAHKAWDVQFENWTTPIAATQLLKLFYARKILSKKSYEFLWKTLSETSTGTGRIKGQLPEGTPVAHKTGSSGTNKDGITAATNDIGIITLPNGKHYVISVFVSDSKENDKTNEKIIADISKLVWDYFDKAQGTR